MQLAQRARPPARDKALSAVLAALVALLIIYLTVPPDLLVPPAEKIGAITMTQPNILGRMIKLGLLLSGVLIILARAPAARRLLKHTNRFFLAWVVLVPLSYLWSISRPDTLNRFVSIASIVAISTAFCLVGWHPRRLQNVVRNVITLMLAASVVLCVTHPELGIEVGEGTLKDAWHGIASQKNIFGMVSSMGVIFYVHGLLAGQVRTLPGLAGLALAFTCVLNSRSSTSILATLLSCFLLLLCMRSPPALRRYMPYLVGSFVVMVLTYALTILHLVPGLDILLVPITHLTGKDMTFSNRTEIWRIIQDHIQLSPILGTGYGAYWIGPLPSSPSYVFLSAMWFYPTESHNGYLEVTNDLGFVGLTVLFGYLIGFARGSLKVLRRDRYQGALFLGLFFQQAIMNLSESCWLAINSGPILPIMTLATMALGRVLLEQRRVARTAALYAAGPPLPAHGATPQRARTTAAAGAPFTPPAGGRPRATLRTRTSGPAT